MQESIGRCKGAIMKKYMCLTLFIALSSLALCSCASKNSYYYKESREVTYSLQENKYYYEFGEVRLKFSDNCKYYSQTFKRVDIKDFDFETSFRVFYEYWSATEPPIWYVTHAFAA